MPDEKEPIISFTEKEMHYVRKINVLVGIVLGFGFSLIFSATIAMDSAHENFLERFPFNLINEHWVGLCVYLAGAFLIFLALWAANRSEKRLRGYFTRFSMDNPPPEKDAIEYI